MLPHSIRWRFLFWLAFLLVCILSGFGITAFQLYRLNQLRGIDSELERRVAALGVGLRGPRFFGFSRAIEEPPRRDSTNGPPEQRAFDPRPRNYTLPENVRALFGDETKFYYIVWSPGGNRWLASSNAPEADPPPRHEPSTRIVVRMRDSLREAYYFNSPGECVLAGRSVATDFRAMRQFALTLAVAGLGVLALGLGGGWWLASRALQPVREISTAASRISEGNLSERINVADTDSELGQLAAVLNSTFGRLEAAFAQQRQFTGDASHELRTPLAVIISELQATLARERTGDEYRDTLHACLDSAQQMRRLTDSLLELARLDAGEAIRSVQRVNLADVAADALDRLQPLVRERNLNVLTSLESASVAGHADALHQVLTNLISNAIYYNRDGGSIEVRTFTHRSETSVVIKDTGIGISPEDMPHIFKRFYRADKARSRASGRAGLGLAITKAIVTAHHGTIDLQSESDRGTTFTVRFPAV